MDREKAESICNVIEDHPSHKDPELIKKQLSWINKPLTYDQKILSDRIIGLSTELKKGNLYIKYCKGYGRTGGFIIVRETDEQPKEYIKEPIKYPKPRGIKDTNETDKITHVIVDDPEVYKTKCDKCKESYPSEDVSRNNKMSYEPMSHDIIYNICDKCRDMERKKSPPISQIDYYIIDDTEADDEKLL